MSHLRPLQRLLLVLSLPLVLACGCTPAWSGASPSGSPTPSCSGAGNGRVVLFVAEDDVWRVRVDGSSPQRLTQGAILRERQLSGVSLWEAMLYSPPRVSPDGCWIACSNGTQLLVAGVPAGTQRLLGPPYVGLYDWAPDSSALAFETGTPPPGRQAEIHIYDPWRETLETVVTLEGEAAKIDHLVWSPDGRDLAFSCCFRDVEPDVEPYMETGRNVGQVRRLDVSTQQVETVGEIEIYVAAGSRLCWTQSGELIASPKRPSPGQAVRCSPAPYGISLISPDGSQKLELSRLSADLTGTRLAVCAYEAGAAGAVLWQREYPDLTLVRASWSPDGQYLLLDDLEPRSPIWRLRADGTGELETVVEDGFFIGAIAAWQ